MRFDGKRALVTGAGKGIGEAAARMLAERGAAVVAVSRSQADLDALRAGIGCEIVAVDLADAAATRAVARAAQPIDLLVNNAGTTELQPFLDTSVETFDRLVAVNACAAMIVAQECARSMIARASRARSSMSRASPRRSAFPTTPPIPPRRERSTP